MSKKMLKTRIDQEIENSIVLELNKWRDGHFGPKLRWEDLENKFGFTRQAMSANKEIKKAWKEAKKELSGDGSLTIEELKAKITKLEKNIEDYKKNEANHKKLESLWIARWQRIAFHIKAKGIELYEVDKPIDKMTDGDVISIFDKPMQPTGRK
jgi:hypothetical protein